jgi:hypothetical protein
VRFDVDVQPAADLLAKGHQFGHRPQICWSQAKAPRAVTALPRGILLGAGMRVHRIHVEAWGRHLANVFVSHRRVDARAAECLAVELRGAGHDVWFDEWAIGLGDSIVGCIEEGLALAAYLVLCCSSSGVNAPWISREWMSALYRQLEGHGIKLLPVLLGGAPPAILADVKFADLGADWSSGVAELLRAIQ